MGKPEFATNRPDKNQHVFAALNDFLHELRTQRPEPRPMDIASAYVNPGGFGLLADELEQLPAVRLVIGADPDAPLAKVRPLADETTAEERALEGHLRSMEEDRNLMGFTVQADRSAQRFVNWLRSGTVECRRYTEGFLHGKAFLVRDHDEGVLAGSANFTYAGLAKNLELDLGHYHPSVVREVASWFDHVWDAAESFDLAAVYEERFEPHSPHLIYLRMLWEKYGEDIEALANADPYGLHLAPFQADGVTLARMILTRYSGVVVADGVGLGKTFVAGELIREAVEERRQKVLVVAPAALVNGPWRAFKASRLFNFDLVSYDELSMDLQLNPDHPHAKSVLRDIDEYAMVVVDEAHAYRNAATQRAIVLSKLLEGTPPKALVMLTATPVNNSLWDLYNLLAYFVRNDAAFATSGIPSLREKFKQATLMDPDALDPDHLFDVLSPVVIRRTRSYVKHYYPDSELTINGVKQRITFPTPEVRSVTYDLSSVLPDFLDRFAKALDVPDESGESVVLSASERRVSGEEALTLARYAPSAYRVDGEFESYEGQVAGLLRSGLLKRFESSSCAFANTCETMAASHDAFLALINDGWVATGTALRELSASDSDDLEDLIEEHAEDWRVNPSDEYDVDRLRSDVEGDRDLLLAWAAEARTVIPGTDPKLAALADQLALILEEAHDDVTESSTERDRRKVIVFSYFADTVNWIRGYLEDAVANDPRLAPYLDRVVAVAGSDRETDQQKALFGFAPVTTEAPPGNEDTFDVMVSTDVLAEGVNLQQARHIINYDLPWNPMRLVQRHGRIDRIGSPHSRVWMRCFMPDKQLDDLLGLEERLHRKIKQAARSIGTEGTIIPGSEVSDRSYTESRDAIDDIRRGDAGFLDETAEGSMSVEEYRQQLREGMENPFLREKLINLAWGSGTGKAVAGAEPGFVFCARVGDNPDPQFRYVNVVVPDKPVVVPDLLSCLKHAYATENTARSLDAETHERAYDAWAIAKTSIHDQWMWATDLRNLQPEIPKAMRDAAELVRMHPPAGYEQGQIDRLYDTLNAPYAERVRKQVRAALATGDTAAEHVAELVSIVDRLALTPPPEPEPLPLIGEDDIHLVCWMAIVPDPPEEAQ